MAETKIKTTARVRVILEVELDDVWGPDCSTGQVYKQACDGVRGALRQGLVIDHLRNSRGGHTKATILTVEPIAILVPQPGCPCACHSDGQAHGGASCPGCGLTPHAREQNAIP